MPRYALPPHATVAMGSNAFQRNHHDPGRSMRQQQSVEFQGRAYFSGGSLTECSWEPVLAAAVSRTWDQSRRESGRLRNRGRRPQGCLLLPER